MQGRQKYVQNGQKRQRKYDPIKRVKEIIDLVIQLELKGLKIDLKQLYVKSCKIATENKGISAKLLKSKAFEGRSYLWPQKRVDQLDAWELCREMEVRGLLFRLILILSRTQSTHVKDAIRELEDMRKRLEKTRVEAKKAVEQKKEQKQEKVELKQKKKNTEWTKKVLSAALLGVLAGLR